MPRRKKPTQELSQTGLDQKWIVYSTNRQHCFAAEISAGYFGAHHICGCKACSPDLVLDLKPDFMPRQNSQETRPQRP